MNSPKSHFSTHPSSSNKHSLTLPGDPTHFHCFLLAHCCLYNPPPCSSLVYLSVTFFFLLYPMGTQVVDGWKWYGWNCAEKYKIQVKAEGTHMSTTVCGAQFHSPCIRQIAEILDRTMYTILVIKCLRTINCWPKKKKRVILKILECFIGILFQVKFMLLSHDRVTDVRVGILLAVTREGRCRASKRKILQLLL